MSDSTDDADGAESTLCDTPDNPDGADASDDAHEGPGPYVNPFDIEFTSAAGELVAKLHAVLDELQVVDLTGCTNEELVAIAGRTEQAIARLTFAGDRQLVECSDRHLSAEMGYRSQPSFHDQYLRIVNPQRRREQMAATATFTSPTGEPLPPKHPALADAFAAGEAGTSHIHTVLDILDEIPDAVAHDVQVAAERTMARHAKEHTPAQLADLGQRLIANLDPDGELTDDADRQRKRGVWINRQRADGTAKLNGRLSPLLASQLSTILAAWAAPGMNNPDDPDSPTGAVEKADAEKVSEAASRDYRSPAQRNHDALTAVAQAVLDGRLLGRSHRGLPIQVIATATLSDLQQASGLATTATGHLIPVRDLLAEIDRGGADTWLSVFADAKPMPLFFGRGRRLATRPQRMAAFSRPDGHVCSVAGCGQPAVHLELHHADQDWAEGGNTDITELFGTCPIHNRRHHPTKPGHLRSRVIPDGPDQGRCGWTLNSTPGAPPNPERVNRLPDIPAHLRWHLQQVRAEIHGPPPEQEEDAGQSSAEAPPCPDTDDTAGPPAAADAEQSSPEAPPCPDTPTTDDIGDSSGDVDPSHRDATSDGPSTETADADTRPDTGPADVPDTDPADARGAAAIPGMTELRIDYRDIITASSELEQRLADLLAAES